MNEKEQIENLTKLADCIGFAIDDARVAGIAQQTVILPDNMPTLEDLLLAARTLAVHKLRTLGVDY